MDAPNLNRRALPTAVGAVIALTALAALAATVLPGLAAGTPPHPTLTGSVSDALAILQNNLRVLAAPYLLWLLGFPQSRLGRHAGDLLIAALTAANTIPVGLALGRWQHRLIPYLPQLPLEFAALAVAVNAWLTIRSNTARRPDVAVLAAVTAMLLLCAASVETWATPHRESRLAASQVKVDAIGGAPTLCGRPWVAFATDSAPGRPGRCKVARSLPLTPFGSARPTATSISLAVTSQTGWRAACRRFTPLGSPSLGEALS